MDELAPAGGGELRRGFAGPLAAAMRRPGAGPATDESPTRCWRWYDAIVASVTGISAGGRPTEAGAQAFAALAARLGDGDATAEPATRCWRPRPPTSAR